MPRALVLGLRGYLDDLIETNNLINTTVKNLNAPSSEGAIKMLACL